MKQALFNSLGSNYSRRFMFQSAFGGGSMHDHRQLEKVLDKHYQGTTTLTYKGREALELALQLCDVPPGSAVGINGFTCYVVYRAVERAGYQPICIDIAPADMHFGLAELKTAHAKHKKLAAIIVQNTLGYPVNIKSLQAYAKTHKIVLIEDGAHSLGASYADGREVGSVGDLAMFSFSQDKPLDVVSGGAVIDRRKNATQTVPFSLQPVSWWQREINRDYPMWTGLIRASYPFGVGRWLHFGLKKLHFLAAPMKDAGPGLHAMSTKTARLALTKWADRTVELQHRRTIASIYEKQIPKDLQLIAQPLGQPAFLRFPLVTDRRDQLIEYLKQVGVYVGDTWYDAPIAPKRYMSQTSYRAGMCPRADKLVDRIVNLPTHGSISEQQAQYIARKVRAWHTSA